MSTLSDFSIRYPEMYSPLACDPNHHQITPVNATPHDTHTADSIAASLGADLVRLPVEHQEVDEQHGSDDGEQDRPLPQMDIEVDEVAGTG